LGTTHRILKWLAAENYELKAVSLPHMPLVSIKEYQRFFGAPILINQNRAALHLSRHTLDSQPHSTNPALRKLQKIIFIATFEILPEKSAQTYESPPPSFIHTTCK
jgi:hypothetical protein